VRSMRRGCGQRERRRKKIGGGAIGGQRRAIHVTVAMPLAGRRCRSLNDFTQECDSAHKTVDAGRGAIEQREEESRRAGNWAANLGRAPLSIRHGRGFLVQKGRLARYGAGASQNGPGEPVPQGRLYPYWTVALQRAVKAGTVAAHPGPSRPSLSHHRPFHTGWPLKHDRSSFVFIRRYRLWMRRWESPAARAFFAFLFRLP
jgi:hypothetical protein